MLCTEGNRSRKLGVHKQARANVSSSAPLEEASCSLGHMQERKARSERSGVEASIGAMQAVFTVIDITGAREADACCGELSAAEHVGALRTLCGIGREECVASLGIKRNARLGFQRTVPSHARICQPCPQRRSLN